MKRITAFFLAVVALVACTPRPGYVVQVSLGSWNHPDYTGREIVNRIDSVCALIPVEKVIIGWSTDEKIYREVGEYLHSRNIKMLLWLPVFAETEEVCDNVPAVDLWGQVPENYDLAAGEGFRFNCPSNPSNVAHIIGLYDTLFAGCGFDGVFLDRVRSQSFVSGVNGVLACGCPICEERFREEGVELSAVREQWEACGDGFLSASAYDPEKGFTLENPVASAFFKAKGRIVSGSVAQIADSLHARGLEVGLDLYAPFMAPFVGQDYSILAQHADFIKPMLYRQTFAPAGMGFEYELLRKAVPGAQGYPGLEMSKAFLDSQLKAMEPYDCGKYPGIEINYKPEVAPTSPEYVKKACRP